jgi:hypothetical protein
MNKIVSLDEFFELLKKGDDNPCAIEKCARPDNVRSAAPGAVRKSFELPARSFQIYLATSEKIALKCEP